MIYNVFVPIYAVIGVVGMVTNFMMVYVTLKSSRLQTACHLLIAVLCFLDFVHCSSPILSLLLADAHYTQRSCFFAKFPSLIGAIPANLVMLELGLDRLSAIVYPTSYERFRQMKYLYVSLVLVIPTVYTTYIMVDSYLQITEKRGSCSLPFALGPDGLRNFSISSVLFIIIDMVVYLLAYFLLRKRNIEGAARGVYKSLFITIFVVVFGNLTTHTISALTYQFDLSDYNRRFVQAASSGFVVISMSSNFFVYYSISKEYREEMEKYLFLVQIKRLFRRKDTARVTTIP